MGLTEHNVELCLIHYKLSYYLFYNPLILSPWMSIKNSSVFAEVIEYITLSRQYAKGEGLNNTEQHKILVGFLFRWLSTNWYDHIKFDFILNLLLHNNIFRDLNSQPCKTLVFLLSHLAKNSFSINLPQVLPLKLTPCHWN